MLLRAWIGANEARDGEPDARDHFSHCVAVLAATSPRPSCAPDTMISKPPAA